MLSTTFQASSSVCYSFAQSLVKAHKVEKNRAIAGVVDDPSVPKRLEDAIVMVETRADTFQKI